MQRQVIQIDNLEPAVLLGFFERINKRLDVIEGKGSREPETYMTRQEVAGLYKVSLPTIHAWMNAGVLKYYKIANKTRFLRAEVLAAATAIKQKGRGDA